jgi:hypothetical protein
MYRRASAAVVITSILSGITVLVSASPVSAQLSLQGDYGGRTKCMNHTVESPVWEVELDRIIVRPPQVYALGDTRQSVGWRLIVWGDDQHSPDTGAPVTQIFKYKSPIQRATAYPTSRAQFTRMVVSVDPPAWTMPGFHLEFLYHRTIKVFWYNADGSVQATDTQIIGGSSVYVDGEHRWGGVQDRDTEQAACWGRYGQPRSE